MEARPYVECLTRAAGTANSTWVSLNIGRDATSPAHIPPGGSSWQCEGFTQIGEAVDCHAAICYALASPSRAVLSLLANKAMGKDGSDAFFDIITSTLLLAGSHMLSPRAPAL